MKFAHQSATIRQHGKGMIILETALETAGLTYVFPDGNGIKNIAFQVKRGEIYALYGGHHAGKSVLLQTIIGTLRPQAGTLKLFGNIDYQKERRRIGFVPQKPVTIGSLSPADMLRYFSSVFGTTEIHVLDILHLNLKEKKAVLLKALEQAKEPTIPELLSRYLDMRSEERTGWTSKGKLKGTVGDFNKVMEALDFLRQKEISTVESLDAYLDKVSGEILSAKTDIRKSERRIKAIDTTLSHIANHGAYKEVYKKYASIGWKTRKEKFAAEHREELDAYLAAKRFFKAHQEELPFDTKELKKEREQLSGELSEKNEGLQAVQEDMKLLRDVRYWINHVLPPDQRRVVPEPGKKPSLNEQLSWNIEGVKQREEQKRQQPHRQQKQDMEL